MTVSVLHSGKGDNFLVNVHQTYLGVFKSNSLLPPLLLGLSHSEYKKVKVKSLIRVRLFVTPWTVAY